MTEGGDRLRDGAQVLLPDAAGPERRPRTRPVQPRRPAPRCDRAAAARRSARRSQRNDADRRCAAATRPQ